MSTVLNTVNITVGALEIFDDSGDAIGNPQTTLYTPNGQWFVDDRICVAHTRRVQIGRAFASMVTPPATGQVTISYRDPHVRASTFKLWDGTPMENDPRLSTLKDYWDVYNPSEPHERRNDVKNDQSLTHLDAYSQRYFRIPSAITAAALQGAQLSGEPLLFLKFDAQASDFGSYPFQGALVVAIVAVTPQGQALETGEESLLVTSSEYSNGNRDVHGFVTPSNGINIQKYHYAVRVDKAFSGTRTFGIYIPWRSTDYHIYITPSWWDFQGQVTLSNFRITNSKIFDDYGVAESLANLGDGTQRPGWMACDNEGSPTKFTLLANDSDTGEVASANGMLLRGYDVTPTAGVTRVQPQVQTHDFNTNNNQLSISLVRNSTGGDRNAGSIVVKDVLAPTGTYTMQILSYYNAAPRKQLCVGYQLLRDGTEIARIRVNGDGTIMIRNMLPIAGGSAEEERLDDPSKGLRIEYVPPSPIGSFPVEFFAAGKGAMIALADGVGVNINCIHTADSLRNMGPTAETALTTTFWGMRSYAWAYRSQPLVGPSVWLDSERDTSDQKSVEVDHFVLYPFYGQVVWINVVPPQEYNPRIVGPSLPDPTKYYQYYTLENAAESGLELYDNLAGMQKVYPNSGGTAGIAQEVWSNHSDYIVVNSEMGLWKAWMEGYVNREENDYRTYASQPPDPSPVTFATFLSDCRAANKRAMLYVSPFFFTQGMHHANNTRSTSRYRYESLDPSDHFEWQYALSDWWQTALDYGEPDGFNHTCVHKDLLGGMPQGNGDNCVAGPLDKWEQAVSALLTYLTNVGTPGVNYLPNIGFYMDGLVSGSLPSAYYAIRKLRELYYQQASAQPAIVHHVAPYDPLNSYVLLALIPEAYCDITYRMEAFGEGAVMLQYGGIKRASSTTPIVGFVECAQDVSLDGIYKNIVSSLSRSNSVAALHVWELIDDDVKQTLTNLLPTEVPRILEKNIAYAQKYGIILPTTDNMCEGHDAFLSMRAWLLYRHNINVTDLGSYAVQGSVSVAGNIVTIAANSIIELPDYAAVQFRVSGQTYRLRIGATGAAQQVIIRKAASATVGWTGFAFWPGDRYGTSSDARLEILSPFQFQNLLRPFRFHQITKGGKMVH